MSYEPNVVATLCVVVYMCVCVFVGYVHVAVACGSYVCHMRGG